MWAYLLPSLAVQINHNWEVEYQDTSVYGVVGKAVILECGNTLPDMYIWSFTKPGTEAIKAVVYDLGKGTRIQKLAEGLGRLSVISNSAAVSIEELPLAAHGLFTCQAFYDIEQEPKVVYYYVHLTVRGKTSPSLLFQQIPVWNHRCITCSAWQFLISSCLAYAYNIIQVP